MKKHLFVACSLAVLATPAFATKARLEALGEDNFGSYYINDNRNQFLNPAKINDNKDLVTYEFGSSSTGSAVTADSAGTPKAEGGFNKSWNNMVYGLHFGNSTPLASTVRALAGTNLQERNAWDLFVGGDAGIKWGANVTYENTNTGGQGTSTTDRLSSNSVRGRVGAMMGDLEVLGQVSLQGNAKDYQGNMVQGRNSYLIGAGYMVRNYKLFADWRHVGARYMASSAAKTNFNYDDIRLGVARQERLNDKAVFFGKVTVEKRGVSNQGAGTVGGAFAAQANQDRYILPLTAGLEYDATSWLQLRGSVSQYVWSQNTINPKTPGQATTHRNLANTVVRAGASLKFGEFQIDGLVSTSANGDDSAGTLNTTPTTAGGNGSLRTDSLMTRVSMLYRF